MHRVQPGAMRGAKRMRVLIDSFTPLQDTWWASVRSGRSARPRKCEPRAAPQHGRCNMGHRHNILTAACLTMHTVPIVFSPDMNASADCCNTSSTICGLASKGADANSQKDTSADSQEDTGANSKEDASTHEEEDASAHQAQGCCSRHRHAAARLLSHCHTDLLRAARL